MARTTGLTATTSPREWDPAAARIEELELRLELERKRAEIRDLRSLLAEYKHDNDRLRSFLNEALREGPAADAHTHAHRGVGVDASVGHSLPSAPIHHAHAHTHAYPHAHAHGQSAAAAMLRNAWDREGSSSWVESRQQQQQQHQEERAHQESQRRAVCSGGDAANRGLRSSCDFCTGSKIRCDGSKPTCGNCQQRGIGCHYSVKRRPGPKPARSASDDLSQAPPTQRPRIDSYDPVEPQHDQHRKHTREATYSSLPPPPISRFYVNRSPLPNPHGRSPMARQVSVGGTANAKEWRASFDDAQVMSYSPPQSPDEHQTRRVAY